MDAILISYKLMLVKLITMAFNFIILLSKQKVH